MDTAKGSVRWSYSHGSHGGSSNALVSPCVIRGSTVFSLASNGVLAALVIDTGALRWRYESGARARGGLALRAPPVPAPAVPTPAPASTSASIIAPTRVNSLVYFGTEAGHVHAVYEVDGSLAWRFNAKGSAPVQRSPTVSSDGNRVFVAAAATTAEGSTDGGVHRLYGIDADTGLLLWERQWDLGSTALLSQAAVVAATTHDWLWLATGSGRVEKLDARDGSSTSGCVYEAPSCGAVWPPPAAWTGQVGTDTAGAATHISRTLFGCADGTLRAVDAACQHVWTYTTAPESSSGGDGLDRSGWSTFVSFSSSSTASGPHTAVVGSSPAAAAGAQQSQAAVSTDGARIYEALGARDRAALAAATARDRFSADGDYVHGTNLADGALLWRKRMPAPVRGVAAPTTSFPAVLASCDDGGLHLIRPPAGSCTGYVDGKQIVACELE